MGLHLKLMIIRKTSVILRFLGWDDALWTNLLALDIFMCICYRW